MGFFVCMFKKCQISWNFFSLNFEKCYQQLTEFFIGWILTKPNWENHKKSTGTNDSGFIFCHITRKLFYRKNIFWYSCSRPPLCLFINLNSSRSRVSKVCIKIIVISSKFMKKSIHKTHSSGSVIVGAGLETVALKK